VLEVVCLDKECFDTIQESGEVNNCPHTVTTLAELDGSKEEQGGGGGSGGGVSNFSSYKQGQFNAIVRCEFEKAAATMVWYGWMVAVRFSLYVVVMSGRVCVSCLCSAITLTTTTTKKEDHDQQHRFSSFASSSSSTSSLCIPNDTYYAKKY